MSVAIAPATADDLPGMLGLLRSANLPTDGVGALLATAVVARDGGALVASAGVELYGSVALLRSVAVAMPYQRHGLGERIARAALDVARERGVHDAYLLTTTAADFFARRLAFRAIARDDVPEVLRNSTEFTVLCPDSAQAMTCNLAPAPV